MPLGTVKGRMRLGLEKIRASLAEGVGRRGLGGAAVSDSRCTRSCATTSRPTRSVRSTGDEAARSRAHLAGCEPCRDYLRWLQPAVDVLPASVAQLEPPPRLGERLMATVRAEAAQAPRATPVTERSADGRRVAELARPDAAAGDRARRRRGARCGRRRLRAAHRRRADSRSAQPTGRCPQARSPRRSSTGPAATRSCTQASRSSTEGVYQVWVQQRRRRVQPSTSFRPDERRHRARSCSPRWRTPTRSWSPRSRRGAGATPSDAPLLQAALG